MIHFVQKCSGKPSKTIHFHWNPYLHVFTNLGKIFEKKSKKRQKKVKKNQKKVPILQKNFQKNLELPHAMPAPFKLTLLTQFRKAPGST